MYGHSVGRSLQNDEMLVDCRKERATYTIALRTSSRGMTPSFTSGKSSCASENSWNTSLISFSSSAVMLFSLASLDGRARFGPVAEELGAAPPLLGGCARECEPGC